MEYTNDGLNDEFKFQKRAEVICLQAFLRNPNHSLRFS